MNLEQLEIKMIMHKVQCSLQQFNKKKLILWYILDTILSDFAKLCKRKYYL